MGMPFAQRTQIDNVLGWCPLGNFYLQRVIVTLGFGSAKLPSLDKGVVNGVQLPRLLVHGGQGLLYVPSTDEPPVKVGIGTRVKRKGSKLENDFNTCEKRKYNGTSRELEIQQKEAK